MAQARALDIKFVDPTLGVDPDQPNYAIPEVRESSRCWPLIDALCGGTQRMRDEHVRWLPQEEAEEPSAYQVRLHHSWLRAALNDAVRLITSKPFSKPLQVKGDAPEWVPAFMRDVDGEGTDATAFARDVMGWGLKRGVHFVFVDHPRVEGLNNAAEEQAVDARPYLCHAEAAQVVGFDARRVGGRTRLESIRIREEATVPDGRTRYGRKRVERVREWTRHHFQVWERDVVEATSGQRGEAHKPFDTTGAGDWRPLHQAVQPTRERTDESGNVVLDADGLPVMDPVGPEPIGPEHGYVDDPERPDAGGIPVVVFYFERTGYLTGESPLWDLAESVVELYQSMSQQKHILRFARIPLLVLYGFREHETKGGVKLGAGRILRTSTPPNMARAQMVEHNGAAMEQGWKDVERIEDRVKRQMKEPFMTTGGDVTATGDSIREGHRQSDVKTWCDVVAQGFLRLLQIVARWRNEAPLPETSEADEDGVQVAVYKEFHVGAGLDKQIEALFKGRQDGWFSREFCVGELQASGVVRDGRTPESIVEEAQAEADLQPSPPSLSGLPPEVADAEDDPPDEDDADDPPDDSPDEDDRARPFTPDEGD